MKHVLSASAVLVLAFGVSSVVRAEPPARPNVLFIAVDDLNHWVGYLGRNRQTRTPNIDKLAARGVAFTRSYCVAPLCNPSRVALMSGLRPSTTGVYVNANDWRPVIAEDKTLTTAFRKAGYYVAGAGKIYHGRFPRRSEWDDYLTKARKNPVPKGDQGVGAIQFGPVDAADDDLEDYHIVNYAIEQLRKKHDKPFFLACGLHKPHLPWFIPRKYFDLHPLDKIELPPHTKDDLADVPPAGVRMAQPQGDHAAILKANRWKDAIQGYLAAISYTDMNIGRLIDALDQSAYRDNTIIVLWSDHGWHLGEKEHWRKFALWEEATRAPLIWVVPGLTKPNGLCERTVDFMSIYPTLLDLCGIPKPAHVEGTSIRPLLADPQATWTLPAVTTYGFKNHTVRTERWRYIRYANGDEELYDESKDPYEWTNLASKPEYAAVKAELARWLPSKDQPEVARERSPK
ncbi:MAG: sulfatase [Gemmataceae bacterium]|nr:sulfatase [Gemmataceae bacterium]MDW8263865.1 sulfatase [Gemmataceae bacterium]